MTGMKRTTEKNLMVFSGRAHPQLAEEVTQLLGTDLVPQSAYEFANSEIYVRYEESVRGCDAFVLQSHTAPINEWIMEHLIMVDALKRASAKRITVVMPFYGYARQDKKHRGREPISARLMADLFKTAGADRLITVDLHADQIQGFFDGPVDHLMALPILADHVRAKYGDQELAVVSPDAGRIKVAERWASRLGGAPLAFIHKSRNIDRPNETVANRVVGDVKGRMCVLVDDMIDTGGTITKAAEALMADGAAGVVIAATHAILSEPAVDRLKNCPVQEVVVTNTLPMTPDREFDKLTQLSIAPLVARAIREVFEDGSVTSMFDGHASSYPSREPDLVGPQADPADEFLRLACLTYGADDVVRRTNARAMLVGQPGLGADNIHVAAARADAAALRRLLAADPALANVEGGPFCVAAAALPGLRAPRPGRHRRRGPRRGGRADRGGRRPGRRLPVARQLAAVHRAHRRVRRGRGRTRQPARPPAVGGAGPGAARGRRRPQRRPDPLQPDLPPRRQPPGPALRVRPRRRRRARLPARRGRSRTGWTPACSCCSNTASTRTPRSAAATAWPGVRRTPPPSPAAIPAPASCCSGSAPRPSCRPRTRWWPPCSTGATSTPTSVPAAIAARPGLVAWAAELGNADGVRRAVELGWDVDRRARIDVPSDQEWETGLHAAAGNGDAAMVRLLLELGADPDGDRQPVQVEAGAVGRALRPRRPGETRSATVLAEVLVVLERAPRRRPRSSRSTRTRAPRRRPA